MSDAWKLYDGAPEPGAVVCKLAAVPDQGTLGVTLGDFPLLVVRRDGSVRAFVNACPHQYLPLDRQGASVLSADGRVLRCTNHQAGFDAETGQGVDGLGVGCALDPVPVRVSAEGAVVIG